MIYLATPYSDPDPAVMQARFEEACRIAGLLMAKGEVVFSPIAHTHPIASRCALRTDWAYWEKYDREMLRAATKLIVAANMDGWTESVGIAAEIKIAETLGIPVEYLVS